MTSSYRSFEMLQHPFPIETPISFQMFTVEGSFQEHAHEFYEIIYICEGKGTLFIHKDSLPFEEGDLFFIPIGMPHLLKSESATPAIPLQMMTCMFQTELLAPQNTPKNELEREFDAIAQFFRQTDDWLRYQDQGGEFARIMYSMNFAVNSQSPGYHYKLYICLLDLLNTMYRLKQFSLLSKPDKLVDPVAFAIEYIQVHYRNPLKMEEFCQWLSISPRHLQRKFKETTGHTYTQMLQQIRVQKSCELLINTDWSIQQIADEVGIHDMKYFYRLFKTNCGLTPLHFRQQNVRTK